MSEHKETGSEIRKPAADADDSLAALMNLAGPRADIPADVEARVHTRVQDEWRNATVGQRRARWAIPAALAATVLIALAFTVQQTDVRQPALGSVSYASGGSRAVGEPVHAGDQIETRAGEGISISLGNSISLRIAASTSLRIDRQDEITLLHGTVYADSGDRIYRDRHLVINTDAGTATDIGTQFSVAYDDDVLSVAVREGRVDVVREQASFSAEAGDRLIVKSDGVAVYGEISSHDPSWAWAAALAPPFDLENRSLLDFLHWAARETGKSLVFSSDDVRMAARSTHVFGSIRNFTPAEAIQSVLSTTQFAYEISDSSIMIK
jgi:hypothetical protein